jgi:hypothetical protein
MIMGDLRRFQQILVVPTLIFTSCAAAGCGGLAGSGGPPGEASIAGSVIDGATKHPVAGAIVAVEQPDSKGIDRIVASTTSSTDGTFSFSGLPQGDYDIVADATVSSAGSTVTYAATVTFGVPLNSSVPDIPIEPEYGNSSPTGSPAQVNAVAVSAGTLGVPVPVDIKLSALQPVPLGHSAGEVTVPLLAGSTHTITTVANLSCESGTACANYSLLIPAAAVSYGTFSASGTQYTLVSQGGPEEVVLTFEGKAFTHGNGSVADCTPANESAFPVTVRGTLASIVPNLAFAGCS